MDQNQKFRLIQQIVDGIFATCKTLIIVAGVVVIGNFLREVLLAFAGKHTEASVTFSVLAKLEADRWFAYLFGAGGVGYGLFQRHLRRRNIRRLTDDKTKAENLVDGKRTSSGLRPDGRTRREDR